MERSNETLWIAPTTRRCFHLPGDLQWPGGETLVFSLAGAARRVDLHALDAFEVPEDVVAGHYQADLRTGLAAMQTAMTSRQQDIAATAPGLESALTLLAESDPDQLDGPEFLGLLLGHDPEALRKDPEMARAEMDNLTARLQTLATTKVPENALVEPESCEYTDAERDAMTAILRGWNTAATTPPADVETAGLWQTLSPVVEPKRGGITLDLLHKAIAKLELSSEDPLSVEGRAARMNRYQEDARAKIAADTQDWHAPQVSFDDLLKGGN